MIRTCRWSLDTCGCVIDQRYDDADYAGTMTVLGIQRCEFHASLSTADAPVHAIGQMKRKNEAQQRLEETIPGATLVNWSFSGTGADRVLTVVIGNITQNQANQIQNWADTKFGAGRVIVQRA